MIARPQPDEYGSFYAGYVNQVHQNADLFKLYDFQHYVLTLFSALLTDEQASIPHQPGEWTVKQIIGHINDTERIFAYRALRIARGDTTPLHGFDQDLFVAGTDFNARTLKSLLDEFGSLRNSNIQCFSALTEAEIDRRGIASDNPISVRALLFIMAGHVEHHINSIKVDYKL